MPGDDPEDERAGGPLPSPAERAWVHPSEMTAFVAATRPAPPPRARIFGALVIVGTVMAAGIVAAMLARTPATTPNADLRALSPAPLDAVAPGVVRVVSLDSEGASAASGVSLGDGQVLTTMSVVEGSVAISVIGAGGRQITASSKGVDPVTDLALLEIPVRNLPAIALGSSSDLDAGAAVIGVALSERGQWVDVGKVAAFDRAFQRASGPAVPGLVETDLSASSQHAGGAVVDRQGRLVGLLLVPPDADTSGLVMPIEDALKVALELHATGRARHGWIGVSVADSKERSGGGAAVKSVVPESPAEKASLEEGDVVVAIADESGTTAIGSRDKLMAEVRRRRPGEHLDLTVYRDGGQRNVTVILRDRPDLPSATSSSLTEPEGS